MLFLSRSKTLSLRLHAFARLEGTLALGLSRPYLADGLLDRAVGIGEDLLGFLAGIGENLVAAFFELLTETLVLGGDFGEKRIVAVGARS